MNDEIDAFGETRTWDLVPRPPNTNVVTCMWLHTHKLNADGTFKRYRSRLVANGKSQEEGVDYNEIVLTAFDDKFLQEIIDTLKKEFPMSDSGKLHYFLGVKADFINGGIFLRQKS